MDRIWVNSHKVSLGEYSQVVSRASAEEITKATSPVVSGTSSFVLTMASLADISS